MKTSTKIVILELLQKNFPLAIKFPNIYLKAAKHLKAEGYIDLSLSPNFDSFGAWLLNEPGEAIENEIREEKYEIGKRAKFISSQYYPVNVNTRIIYNIPRKTVRDVMGIMALLQLYGDGFTHIRGSRLNAKNLYNSFELLDHEDI